MKLSINWLKTLVDIPCSTEALVTKFNLMSSEVEEYKKMVVASNLTVGHVLTCIMHPQSDHLHICTVDVSSSVLQIVCGAPNVSAGQNVIVALEGAVLPGDFKIKKSTIRGVESCGMICSLDELGIDHKYHQEDGIHVLPESAIVGSDPLAVLHLNDEMIDLKLTPNRGDLMSMMGVAYDVSAMLQTPMHLKTPKVLETQEKNSVSVSSKTGECRSYYARVVKNAKIKESPEWMKARLIAAGIRPINNIVDITNYVMLETGQPLHAFDFDKLASNTIVVRNAGTDASMLTLDGKKRDLLPEDLVITDGNKPVALAGVMGGESTQIDANTTSILLESAIFDPLRVRKTSNRLDLRSESSSRFEKGLDPNRTLLALNRACELLQELADAHVLKGISSFETQSLEPLVVELSLAKLIKVTGYAYKESEVGDAFKRLNFPFDFENGVYKVKVPTRRIDIKTYQDLIEEVVRIVGYEQIPTTLQASSIPGSLTSLQRLRREIRTTLVTLGLNETFTYSLTTDQDATMFDSTPKTLVKLLYPIVENKGTMRHSALPSMLEVLNYNLSRKNEDINLFEIAKGYTQSQETEYVAGVMSGVLDSSLWQGVSKPIDFYGVKGLLNALFKKLGIGNVHYQVPTQSLPNLHPGISAEVLIGSKVVGYLGKLHPTLLSAKGLLDTYVFELELNELLLAMNPHVKMQEISKYPSVSRDLAIVVDKKIPAIQVVEAIKKGGKKVLSQVKIFDVYEGEKLGVGLKSIALSLIFQDYEKTLSTEEIDQLINRILKSVKAEVNGELRA